MYLPEHEEDYVIPSVDVSEDPSLPENADPIIQVPTSMTSDDGETQYADTSEEVSILD